MIRMDLRLMFLVSKGTCAGHGYAPKDAANIKLRFIRTGFDFGFVVSPACGSTIALSI